MSRHRRDNRPDPRVQGGTYVSGYWSEAYQVLDIEQPHCFSTTCWTVRWADGRITHHATAWDWRRDQILDTPQENN